MFSIINTKMSVSNTSQGLGGLDLEQTILAAILIAIVVLMFLILLVIIFNKNNKNNKKIDEQTRIIKFLTEGINDLKETIDRGVNKSNTNKTGVIRKAELTTEQIVLRNEKRTQLEKRATIVSRGKKITMSQIKKFSLTDLYGVAKKRAAYYNENKIDDIYKLSKINRSELTPKFVDQFPALTSWTREMKLEIIMANIAEARYMIEILMNK